MVFGNITILLIKQKIPCGKFGVDDDAAGGYVINNDETISTTF